MCGSINPGETTRPLASITWPAFLPERSPISIIRSPITPISAWYQGLPDPSITLPFKIIRSYSWDIRGVGKSKTNNATKPTKSLKSQYFLLTISKALPNSYAFFRWQVELVSLFNAKCFVPFVKVPYDAIDSKLRRGVRITR